MSNNSNSNKDNKLFEKLKQLFRLNKGASISNLGTLRLKEDYTLTEEQSQRVAPGTLIHKRIQAIQEVAEIARNHRLEENAISSLWDNVNDLFNKNIPPEHRHLVFSLIKSIIIGQFSYLGILRKFFFNFIKNHNIAEDVSYRLELLECLTDHGRDILYLEEEICPWLTHWGASELAPAGFTLEWLGISINVIRYNATYLDDDVINTVVESSFYLCCYSKDEKVVLASLELLETIVCYNHLPTQSLPIFISALCHTVNSKNYCQQSWKTMRKLLGTHMGYSAIFFICQLLEQKHYHNNPGIIRGGIFYINMALWSDNQVKSIQISLLRVLPSVHSALMCENTTVVFEGVLGMKLLVTKLGATLQNTIWNNVLLILKRAAKYIMNSSDESSVSTIADHLNEILTKIELFIESNTFNGSRDIFCEVLEVFSLYRPESSIFTLMAYRKEFIVPTLHEWIENLYRFLNYYYTNENRTSIKIVVINTMKALYRQHSTMYEAELVQAIQHVFGKIVEENNTYVRKAVCQFIIDVCNDCDKSHHEGLLQILKTLLMRPFQYEGLLQEQDVVDVLITVEGLSKLFVKYLYQYPATSADSVFVMLIAHLHLHYQNVTVLEHLPAVRSVIITLLVKLRADSKFRLGVLGLKEYSPFIYVDCSFDKSRNQNISTEDIKLMDGVMVRPNYMPLAEACKTLLIALERELDWNVLTSILKAVPQILKNKALVLSKKYHEADSTHLLASTLCGLVVNDKRASLKNTPPKWSKTDFQIALYPALAAFVPYHNRLDSSLLQKIVKCLISGLVNRCVRPVITALTTCILEMREIMIKLLPEVLLNMSKLSATSVIAIPVLEFLSMLSRLPKVYSNFVIDQYMSVFAITLPYTNPFKYNHYTVSLAHRVIAIWFLKCRPSFRRNFVEFIKKGLNQNVLAPFEGHSFSRNNILNEDSTNRKRSSSLTEQGSRGRDRSNGGGINVVRSPMNDLRPPIDNSLLTFHKELTETCMDLLARYAFATCSALPKRHPTADFILKDGQSATWLLGTKLITISTSACTQKPFRSGLCNKCCQSCCPVDDPFDNPKLIEKMRLAVARSLSSETSDQHDGNTSAKGVASPSCLSTATSSPGEESKKFSHVESDGYFDQKDFLFDRYENLQNCICWCQSWAEICIRCPTGDMSWMMRVQNDRNLQEISGADSALFDVSTLFHPSRGVNATNEDLDKMTQYLNGEKSVLEKLAANDEVLKTEFVEKLPNKGPSEPVGIPGSPLRFNSSRQNSQESCEVEDEYYDVDDYENEEDRLRNPVRRSNSSPEMSSGWKNPFFIKDRSTFENENMDKDMDISKHLEMFNTPVDGKKMKQNYPKDLRYNTKGANCEAIPEEICGTGSTPPSNTCLPKPLTLNLNLYSVEKKNDLVHSEKKNLDKEKPKLVLKTSSKLNSFNESDSSTRSSAESVDLKQSIEFPLAGPYQEEKSRSLTSTPSYLTKKPPLSPPINYGSQTLERHENDSDPPMFRTRVHTLAVMNTIKRPVGLSSNTSTLLMTNRSNQSKEPSKSGINPSFVFLQLYHSTYFGNVDNDLKPMLLPPTETGILRAVQNLDWIPPYEFHKIGVIYVGPGQVNSEQEILANQHGSLRYTEFIKGLGTLIKLSVTDKQRTFLGGLEKKGGDGKFTYLWRDDITQVIFHIATLMPTTLENDPKCYNKKKHIGNDYVTIVYNESGQDYDIQTVKGQFNFGCVIIEPLEHGINEITLKVRDELREHVGHQEPKIVSDQNTAMLARQLAIHTELASQILSSLTKKKDSGPFASNWLERLRFIKRIQAKVKALESQATGSDTVQMTVRSSGSGGQGSSGAAAGRSRVQMSDFTKYT